MPAPEARIAYVTMRRAVDALVTGSEPIRARLQIAEESFRTLDPETQLATGLERNLYHRIASSLVSGGTEDEDTDDEYSPDAVAASIATLDADIAVLISRDMLRLYELTASPPDESLVWPSQRWPDDRREERSSSR
jgi:hypothetical protein